MATERAGFVLEARDEVSQALNRGRAALRGYDEALGRTGRSLKNFSRQTEQGRDSLGRFTRSLGRTMTVGLNQLSMALGRIGTAFTPLTLAFGAAGRSAIDFERQMSHVQAVMRGALPEDMKRLTDRAKELGATTAFSATQAAGGMESFARAGFDAAQTLDAIAPALDLAAAGGMQVGEAAAVSASILKSFDREARQAGQTMDVLAVVATNSAANVRGLGQTFPLVAAQARGAGLSFEETAGFVAAMANSIPSATRQATALGQALNKLLAPTSKGEAALQALNVQLTQNGRLRPMVDVFEDISEGLSKIKDEGERAQTAIEIFGIRGSRAFNAFQTAGADFVRDITNQATNAEGALARMAEIRLDNLSGQLTLLRSALEGLAIATFQNFLEPMKRGVAEVTRIVSELTQRLNAEGLGTLETILIGVAAAIGPVALGLAGLGAVLAGIGTAVTALSAMFAAVAGVVSGPLIAGIAAAAAVFVLFKDQIFEFGRGFLSAIQPAIQAVQGTFQQLWQSASRLITQISTILGANVGVWNDVFHTFGTFAGTVFNGILTAFLGLVNQGIRIWEFFGSALIKVFGVVATGVTKIFEGILMGVRFVVRQAIKLADAVGVEVSTGLRNFANGVRVEMIEPMKAAEQQALATARAIGSIPAPPTGGGGGTIPAAGSQSSVKTSTRKAKATPDGSIGRTNTSTMEMFAQSQGAQLGSEISLGSEDFNREMRERNALIDQSRAKAQRLMGTINQAANSLGQTFSALAQGTITAGEAAMGVLKNILNVVIDTVKQTVMAYAVEAAAGGAKSVAGTPIIGPLLAGGAAIAMLTLVQGLLSNMPSAHTGGMFDFSGGRDNFGNTMSIPGRTSGTEGLALVRHGETRRTPEQEAALQRRLAQSGGGGGGTTIFQVQSFLPATGTELREWERNKDRLTTGRALRRSNRRES